MCNYLPMIIKESIFDNTKVKYNEACMNKTIKNRLLNDAKKFI